MTLAKEGDQRATEWLLDRYRPKVESWAKRYFFRGAEQEDVIQEGMIGLYKAIRDFRRDRSAHFSAFADLCIHRQIESAVKTFRRKKHGPLNSATSLYTAIGERGEIILLDVLVDPWCPNPEREALARILQEELDALVRNLSDLERQVLEYYILAWPYAEIAKALGRSTKCVDNAIQRIMKK
ncbi:MAG: RNA polymerase sporulation sigma factor SigH, partial [Armatimonadota bacterium]